jgi:hypothetical protein
MLAGCGLRLPLGRQEYVLALAGRHLDLAKITAGPALDQPLRRHWNS